METKYSQIRGAGLGLAAVSYDSPEVLKAFSERMHISFPLLSDQDSTIIRRFGILNDQVKENTPQYGIPYPGIYILNAHGKVTAKYFEDDYKERDAAGLILLRQFGLLPAEHSTVNGKHLTVSAAVSDTTVHTGQHVSLILDVVVPDKVHVYAPGVRGYKPVQWNVEASAALKVGDAKFPESRLMRLAAIEETVPVYTGRIRLIREVTLGSDKEVLPVVGKDGELVIKSALSYQACDERECFLPEVLPVTVALRYEAMDRTRVAEGMRRK